MSGASVKGDDGVMEHLRGSGRAIERVELAMGEVGADRGEREGVGHVSSERGQSGRRGQMEKEKWMAGEGIGAIYNRHFPAAMNKGYQEVEMDHATAR